MTGKLHIGHGKTGTSYIQAALAASGAVLNDHHIHYPLSEAVRVRALAGHVTTGNLKASDLSTVLNANSLLGLWFVVRKNQR